MATLKTATHRISVSVEEGSIRVEPDTLTMSSQDEIHWAGTTSRGFSIEFEGRSPFAERKLSHAQAQGKRRPASTGRFKYTVISDANPGLKLDPVIIVEDPPTPHP
jgi:plastocyanin